MALWDENNPRSTRSRAFSAWESGSEIDVLMVMAISYPNGMTASHQNQEHYYSTERQPL
jgi:hypothetical protein